MPTATRPALTPTQERVFRFLADHLATKQRMPTLREIAAAHGWHSPYAAVVHLGPLVKKGYLRWDRHTKGAAGAAVTRGYEIVGLSALLAPVVAAHVARALDRSIP